MSSPLKWTRHYPGYYTSGHFTIERTETRYGSTWRLTLVDEPAFERTKPTLHECQAIAGSMAKDSPLFTLSSLSP